MQARGRLAAVLTIGACLVTSGPAQGQSSRILDADCAALRERLAAHARLSEGVRRAVTTRVAAMPAASGGAAATAAAPSGRAGAVRARLEQIPRERQALEDQRLAAMVKFELSRASQIQAQIQALDAEKAALEREAAALPATSPVPAPAPPPAALPDAARVSCQEVPAAVDEAVRIRRRELGAGENQAGAIPLVALTGRSAEDIGKELAAQLSSAPPAGAQVGLLDADGDGRLDGFVDMPAPRVFRLVRQRADGTIGMETFPAGGREAAPAYGELTRRLDETSARGQTLADLLATRPASPLRAVAQTADFGQAYAQFQAGDFADAARVGAAAARSTEFQNLRGQSVRVIEVVSPVSGGVSLRRATVLAQPNDQEAWEETTTIVRPTSYWRTDVEVTRTRETRAASGTPVGARSVSGPGAFVLER